MALLTSKYSGVNFIVFCAEVAGEKFAGPNNRTILAETNLVELGRRLPDNMAGQMMDYLGSIWRLYCVSMAQKLCENWANYIADFSAVFLVMYHHEELLQNPGIRRMKLLGRRRVKLLVGRKMTNLSGVTMREKLLSLITLTVYQSYVAMLLIDVCY